MLALYPYVQNYRIYPRNEPTLSFGKERWGGFQMQEPTASARTATFEIRTSARTGWGDAAARAIAVSVERRQKSMILEDSIMRGKQERNHG